MPGFVATACSAAWCPGARGRLLVLAIGKSHIAQTGADRKHAPMVDVLHVRDLAQALDHRVVVHDHDRLMAFETRQPPDKLGREIEILTFPVARQVPAPLHHDPTPAGPARPPPTQELRGRAIRLY